MFGARKTQQKIAASARCDYTPSLFALSYNGLEMMQSPYLVADGDELFVISFQLSSLIYLVCHIIIVCQHYNKFAFVAHFSSGCKKSLQAKKNHQRPCAETPIFHRNNHKSN